MYQFDDGEINNFINPSKIIFINTFIYIIRNKNNKKN